MTKELEALEDLVCKFKFSDQWQFKEFERDVEIIKYDLHKYNELKDLEYEKVKKDNEAYKKFLYAIFEYVEFGGEIDGWAKLNDEPYRINITIKAGYNRVVIPMIIDDDMRIVINKFRYKDFDLK